MRRDARAALTNAKNRPKIGLSAFVSPVAGSPVREVTGFQSECFDSNFRKRPAGFDSFIRGHQGRNDCRSLGRISFGHEKD
jgi:hypothetical protein